MVLLTPAVTVLAKLPTPEKQVRMAPSAMARLRQELVEGVGAFPGAVDAVVDGANTAMALELLRANRSSSTARGSCTGMGAGPGWGSAP